MKILYVLASSDLPESELIIKMAQRHEVKVISSSRGRYFNRYIKANLDVVDYEFKSKFDRDGTDLIRKIIESKQFDIVHAFTSKTVACALRAVKGKNLKVLGYRGVSTNNSYRQLENWITFLSPRLDGIFCVSEAVKQSLLKAKLLWLKLPSQKLKTIYKGHNPEWYAGKPENLEQFGIPKTANTLCCISRNSAHKGVSTLLDAFDRFSEDKNLHLLLIGKIDQNQEVLAKVQQCKYPQRVHFTGYVNNPTEIMQAATMLVSASQSGEGLPRVVLEAMCVECPVVATDAGGTRELVINNKTGLLIQPNNKKALYTAINKVLTNPKSAKERANQALEHIKSNFSPEMTLEKTEGWYREILSKSEAL